jgi:hypothetical protein
MPEATNTLVTDGFTFFTNGSRICPDKHSCDVRKGESADRTSSGFERYMLRHSNDHALDFDKHAHREDVERNLTLHCLYFGHKYTIGNPKLIPDPFWETHAFVSNWWWNPQDLEQGVPMAERTFEIPPADKRRAGEYRRYMQLEIPRKCMKTSTASKAYVTQESMFQYFVLGNIYFRVILISATSTLTTHLMSAYKAIWARNQNIKRLFGKVITRGKGRNAYTERISLLDRNCKSGKDALAFRWLSNAENPTGKASFNFMVGGVGTETTGERADLYIFDDPATGKNSHTAHRRQEIKDCFSEMTRQLEHTGRMIVCNTRKHLEDFGGMIGKEPLRSQFHTLHRKAVWVDPATKQERFYYPIDGEGEPQLDRKNLDHLRASMTEREFSSEYLNEPLDPSRALFRREDFQIVNPKTVPIEIQYGRGRDLTRDEANELAKEKREIFGVNHCDPAGKEEQSARGDDSAIVCWRRDNVGKVYITYLRAGQWTSSQLWEQLYQAFCYNRPNFTDYEKPTNDLHTIASYTAWLAEKQKLIDDATPRGEVKRSADIRPRFEPLSKANKHLRIEQMEPLIRNKRLFILSDAAPADEIEKFIAQFLSYLISEHDDYPDCAARMVPILGPMNYEEETKKAMPESDFAVDDGVTRVPLSVLLEMNNASQDGLLWGQRGRADR